MDENSQPVPHAGRQASLGEMVKRRKLSSLLINKPANIFYLTGFRGSAGIAAFAPDQGVLWVDPRYTLQAREEAHGVDVIEVKASLLKAAARWLRKRKARRVGYDDAHFTCRELNSLQKAVAGRIKFEPASGIVEKLRLVKDTQEVAQIREACRVAVAAFEETIPQVKPGVRECDLAAEIEFRMRRLGAESPAFETIVASGPRGAFPHARASQKVLAKGELVIFDLGAILGGYASDMTRTLYLGRPSFRTRKLYRAVREAQQRAIQSLRKGVRCLEVDAAARHALERRGLEKYFTHSTGHGVGLEIHENPRLGKRGKSRMDSGCVVTVEPGIYLPGVGGIRLEDTILVGQSGPEVLTLSHTDNWFIE